MASLVTAAPAASSTRSVASIRRYCSQVDAYVQRHPENFDAVQRDRGPRNDGNGQWRRWPTSSEDEQLDSNAGARVWRRNGLVTFVAFTIQSESRDWALFVTNYYRPDGTVAKLQSTLNTFAGSVTVERDWYYAADGSVLHFTSRCYKLGTRERLKAGCDFHDVPVPLYRTIAQLPFYHLLSRRPPAA